MKKYVDLQGNFSFTYFKTSWCVSHPSSFRTGPSRHSTHSTSAEMASLSPDLQRKRNQFINPFICMQFQDKSHNNVIAQLWDRFIWVRLPGEANHFLKPEVSTSTVICFARQAQRRQQRRQSKHVAAGRGGYNGTMKPRSPTVTQLLPLFMCLLTTSKIRGFLSSVNKWYCPAIFPQGNVSVPKPFVGYHFFRKSWGFLASSPRCFLSMLH